MISVAGKYPTQRRFAGKIVCKWNIFIYFPLPCLILEIVEHVLQRRVQSRMSERYNVPMFITPNSTSHLLGEEPLAGFLRKMNQELVDLDTSEIIPHLDIYEL